MALNVLRGRGKAAPVMPEPLAIGETERDVFSCPVCARPLAQGAGRCAGCGTRLLLGVPAKRAAAFLGLGAIVGMLVGGMVAATAVSLATPQVGTGTGSTPLTKPTQPPVVATRPPVVENPGVPSIARSALGQVGELHVRMATGAALLDSALEASTLDVSDVASLLRSLAADAAYGTDLAPRLAEWDDASPLAEELVAFYAQLRDTARDGLRASLTDAAAYRAAGVAMLDALDGMTTVDADARALADDADVDMPALPGPGAVSAP
jgi:hypothetical protein